MAPVRSSLRRPRVIEIALALSLAFNIFMLGGFAVTVLRFGPPPPMAPEKRMERLAHDIGIDPANSPAFEQFRTSLRLAYEDMHSKSQPLVDPFWIEMAKPQPDTQYVSRLMSDITANREAFQRHAAQAVVDFMLRLPPEQRAAFIRIVNDRRNVQGQPMRVLLGN